MGLRDIGHTLPPGFRFYPSDEELVCHYLYKKVANEHLLRGTLIEIDLHTCEPWQLPDVAKMNSNEWYFFSFRDRKYATGFRTNRATISGYWKATGKDKTVVEPIRKGVVGMRKTLVFYKNRAPNGTKTGWIMHEFRLHNPHLPPKEDWVLCRVFYKSNGEKSLYDDGDTSPNLAASPTSDYQTINSFSHHQHHNAQNPSYSNPLGFSRVGPTGLNLSHDQELDMNMGPHLHPSTSKLVEAKCEDDYGFLFDMSFEFYSNNGGLDQDVRFENEVFI